MQLFDGLKVMRFTFGIFNDLNVSIRVKFQNLIAFESSFW